MISTPRTTAPTAIWKIQGVTVFDGVIEKFGVTSTSASAGRAARMRPNGLSATAARTARMSVRRMGGILSAALRGPGSSIRRSAQEDRHEVAFVG